MARMISTVLLCALVTLSVGCGGNGRPALVTVRGKVTLNGAPLEGATVMFVRVPEKGVEFGRPSVGVTDAQGEFTVSTYAEGDGLAVGKYLVGVEKRELIGDLPKDFNSELADQTRLRYKLIVPKTFRDPTTSGLSVDVSRKGLEPAVIELSAEGAPEIETTGPVVNPSSA